MADSRGEWFPDEICGGLRVMFHSREWLIGVDEMRAENEQRYALIDMTTGGIKTFGEQRIYMNSMGAARYLTNQKAQLIEGTARFHRPAAPREEEEEEQIFRRPRRRRLTQRKRLSV